MQSAAMALAFGSNFQYGKRKISSMSNEDFNAMSALDMNIDLANTVNSMIPSVEQSFKQMEQMNITILESLSRYLGQAISFGLDVLTGKRAVTGTGGEHFEAAHILENIGLAETGAHPHDQPVDTEFLHDAGIGASGASGPTTTQTTDQQFIGPQITSAMIRLQATLRSLTDAQFKSNYRAYLRGRPTETGKKIYKQEQERRFPADTTTPSITTVSEKPMGLRDKQIQTTLVKHFNIVKTAHTKEKQLALRQRIKDLA